MHAADAHYRRLNQKVRRVLRSLERRLDADARRVYLTLEEAVNERDSYRLDSVAMFAFALGYRTATAASAAVVARETGRGPEASSIARAAVRPGARRGGVSPRYTPSKSSESVTPRARATASKVAKVTFERPLSSAW